jgi:hypothetical protein
LVRNRCRAAVDAKQKVKEADKSVHPTRLEKKSEEGVDGNPLPQILPTEDRPGQIRGYCLYPQTVQILNAASLAPPPKASVIIAFLTDFIFSDRPKINFQSHRRRFMEEVPGGGSGSRRNEDIALDLMKFVAMTTGYGRTTSSGVGFQGTGAAAKPEEYAGHLLELYGKCLQAVAGKK